MEAVADQITRDADVITWCKAAKLPNGGWLVGCVLRPIDSEVI